MDKKPDATITITSSDPELNYWLVSAIRNALPDLHNKLNVQVEELPEPIKVFDSLEEAEAVLSVIHERSSFEEHRGDYVVIDGHYTLDQVSALSYLARAGKQPAVEPVKETPVNNEPGSDNQNAMIRLLAAGQDIITETVKQLELGHAPNIKTTSWVVTRILDDVTLTVEFSPHAKYMVRFRTADLSLLLRLANADIGYFIRPRMMGDVESIIQMLNHFSSNWDKGGSLLFTPVPGLCAPFGILADFEGT